MDVFLSIGERSGDQMAAQIIEELQKLSHYSLRISGITGPRSSPTGLSTVFDYTEHAVAGEIGDWSNVFDPVLEMLRSNPPKVFVGITHHAFNVPLAKELGAIGGIHRVMIGPPEAWAWDSTYIGKAVGWLLGKLGYALRKLCALWSSRFLRRLSALCIVVDYATHRASRTMESFDELICLFPMGHDYYRDRLPQGRVLYYGHGCADEKPETLSVTQRNELRQRLGVPEDSLVLGIFPGSRRRELEQHLPVILGAFSQILAQCPDVFAIISVVDGRLETDVQKCIQAMSFDKDMQARIAVSLETPSKLLSVSDYGVFSSGTMTLQAALAGVPGCVVYHMFHAFWRRLLARPFVRHKKIGPEGERRACFSLPNAILLHSEQTDGQCLSQATGRTTLPYKEFVYGNFNASAIAEHMLEGLGHPGVGTEAPHVPDRLPEQMVSQIRRMISPPTGGDSSWAALVARDILLHLNASEKDDRPTAGGH